MPGPMVYSLAYFPVSLSKQMKSMEFADSKQLTEEKREEIFEKLISNHSSKDSNELSNVGWFTKILSPNTISNGNFKRSKYNLNALSHDTAIGLIQLAIESGIHVTEVYVDTVGPKEKYEAKLKSIFPDIQKIKVENKADSLFHVVSAASICAKVTRDRILSSWKFPEENQTDTSHDCASDGSNASNVKVSKVSNAMTVSNTMKVSNAMKVSNTVKASASRVSYGSGYPGDPATKSFLSSNIDSIFGFPTLVRFSWSTVKVLLEDRALEVVWEGNEDEDEGSREGKEKSAKNTIPITNFFKRKLDAVETCSVKKCKQSYEDPPFFAECDLTRPTSLFL